tara:strand:+ start:348 stop:740 length:393 start_codon:yes stop_codon:yes gene_type:complete
MKSIFSKIINKEIPCHLVFEDQDNIAFMDINPIALGHVLVVPKKEVDNIFDLDSNTYQALWGFAKKVSFALKKTIPCNRVGVSVIGLEVPHAHIHLIPINKISDMDFQNKILSSSINLEELAQKISNNII